MTPLTSASFSPNLRAANEALVEDLPPADPPTVTIYGSSDDLIEVEGTVPGCDEYNADGASFVLTGDTSQVRVRAWYNSRGVWEISTSQVAEGTKVLPVQIEDGENTYSVRAVIKHVRLVTREFEGKE